MLFLSHREATVEAYLCVKKLLKGWGRNSVEGRLLSKLEALDQTPSTAKKTNKQKKTKTKVGQFRLCCSKGHKLRFTDNLEGKRKDAYLPIKYMQLNFSGCLISMGRKNPSLSHYLFRQIKELFHLASNTVGVISDHKQYWWMSSENSFPGKAGHVLSWGIGFSSTP